MKSKKENIKDCLDMCLSLSDDKNYHKMIKKLTHNERVCFLLDNGFEFDLPEEESKELESLYRKSIAKKELMTKTIKVAKKDVKKFEELISDFNKWMKENTPLEKE